MSRMIVLVLSSLLLASATFSQWVNEADSIGFTLNDYLTNGSPTRNLLNFGDGQLAFARMASTDSLTSGVYYKFFDGSSWSTPWEPMGNSRGSGGGSIDQFADAGGVEVVVSHILAVDVDAARGAGVWSQTIPGCVGNTWPRLAIGDVFFVHVIATDGNPPSALMYHRSSDAGATWVCDNMLSHSGAVVSPDGYDITARGSKVAILVAGAGGDVVLLESLDYGITWNEIVIYDIDETGMTAGDEPPDGSCSVIYDAAGNLHAAWGSFLYDGSGTFHESRDAEIRHWTQENGILPVAFPDPDTSIVSHGGRNGNYASQPDLSVSVDNPDKVFLTFSRYIGEQDMNGNFYEHVFVSCYNEYHDIWWSPTDITRGTGFDAAFPSAADWVDDELHIIYTKDPLAGNSVKGIHSQIPVAYMYHRISTWMLCLIVGSTGPDRTNISDYALLQNYPNPFNGISNFEFRVLNVGEVSLIIYDLLGREVATIVNERLAPGTYSRQWDAAGLPSGVYYYRLTAGSYVESRKLVLLQ